MLGIFFIVLIVVAVIALKGARKRTERRQETFGKMKELLTMPEEEFQAYKDSIEEKSKK